MHSVIKHSSFVWPSNHSITLLISLCTAWSSCIKVYVQCSFCYLPKQYYCLSLNCLPLRQTFTEWVKITYFMMSRYSIYFWTVVFWLIKFLSSAPVHPMQVHCGHSIIWHVIIQNCSCNIPQGNILMKCSLRILFTKVAFLSASCSLSLFGLHVTAPPLFWVNILCQGPALLSFKFFLSFFARLWWQIQVCSSIG